MYPNLYYACKDVFGISIPVLKAVNSVGFFIAIAFIPGAWMWRYELKRKEKRGELTYRLVTITVGKAAPVSRLLLHFMLGFVAGYKLLYLLLQHNSVVNTSAYIFSWQGSFWGGLIAGSFWVIITWYYGKQEELSQPEVHKIKVWPHECVAKGIIVAGIAGVIGAKLFGIAENWNWFIKAPLNNLFSSEGFAFLGGLIVATFAMWWYHYSWGVQRMRMADALAPSLLLSYALGRLGCQIGGDGDWGITNVHPKPFHWLPDWLWAYDYPHNVANIGVYMKDCTWDNYCYHLAVPVYPTPLYELIAGLLLFGLLLLIRRNITLAGRTSAFYLMLCGIERFFIEKIRVNIRYSMAGFHPTQAEILSVFLFIAGIALYFIAPYLNANKQQKIK
ncbi:prolipoprotein diacylglyceryl transferase [Ilyomonas limi]|uniref:Prolipoprotein diacylglyceryl transferase n=1 Tax=Ilyomonas limi TaxID=2575867 RepID=A0A4U3KZ63_9BACT|nr:prolipoprotein diacylglyceryl transferase family protein [Ilyomonas limi]TKK67955.1 prolipoprotein diacylglyceryl transferase [Ilyomonas limi]